MNINIINQTPKLRKSSMKNYWCAYLRGSLLLDLEVLGSEWRRFERASAANVCVLRNPIDQTFCGVAGGSKRNCSNMANLIIPPAHRPASQYTYRLALHEKTEHNKRTTPCAEFKIYTSQKFCTQANMERMSFIRTVKGIGKLKISGAFSTIFLIQISFFTSSCVTTILQIKFIFHKIPTGHL